MLPSSAETMRQASASLRWWTVPTENGPAMVGAALHSYASALADQQSTHAREVMFRRYTRLYGNAQILGLKPWEYQQRTSETRVTRNVVASCVDTATAMIAANRPAPQFLTNGADYKLRRKADKLNKFGKGLLYASDFYRIAPAVFRDGCVYGLGIAKILTMERRIRTERVFPWDILVEDADGMNGSPRTMIQRAYIARDVALSTWTSPEAQQAIGRAKAIEHGPGDSGASDVIVVYEGWHLPSKEGADDGRHVLAVEGFALVDEPWKRPHHPFAVFRWSNAIAGFWGVGIAEMLTGIQFEINTLLIKVQDSFRLGAMYKVILNGASGVPKAHVNNEIGAIYIVNNGTTPPTIVAPQTVHPEVFKHIDSLEVKAFDEIGISQMSARSEKPAGLDSGVALQNYNDIKSDRFVMVGRAWEDFHLDAVKLGLDEAREIEGFTVDVPDKNAKIEIKWTDVNLERDAYILQCFPTSLLPQTPAGRIQGIQDLVQLGALPQDSILEMLGAPDLEEITDIATSARRATRARVAAMLDDGDWAAPDPRMIGVMPWVINYVNAVYFEEQEKGAPEDRLDLLRDYVDECVAIMDQAQGAAQPPAGATPAGPQPTGTPISAPPAGAPVAPQMAAA